MSNEIEPASRKLARELVRAVEEQSPEFVDGLLKANKELWSIYHSDELYSTIPLIYRACREHKQPCQRNEMIKLLQSYGADINAAANFVTPLVVAVWNMDVGLVQFLLEHGADANNNHVFRRIKSEHKDAVEIARLLLDSGGDVNFIEDGVGDTALDWIAAPDSDLTKYLISRGAKYSEQILGPNTKAQKPVPEKSLEAKIDKYFSKVFGPVATRSIQSIVPLPNEVNIRWVPAGSKSGFFKKPHPNSVLFTNGLSRHPLAVPAGSEDFRYAELVIQLPPTWPKLDVAMQNESTAWPVQWLRRIADQVISTGDWLGEVACVIANEDLKPLGAGCSFVAWLLLVRHEIQIHRKMQVVLYSCFPIYREEYELERKHGTGFLAGELGRGGVQDAIDVNRPNLGIRNQ